MIERNAYLLAGLTASGKSAFAAALAWEMGAWGPRRGTSDRVSMIEYDPPAASEWRGSFVALRWLSAADDFSQRIRKRCGSRFRGRRRGMRIALKTALKTALKDDNDEIVAKILAVYKEIANNTAISLGAVAEKVGLSARTVDEYVGIMKSANVLRRKGGRKFGEWEILTVDSLDDGKDTR